VTSLLYIAFMNEKLIPDGVQISYAASFRLNAWAFTAIIVASLGRWLIHDSNPEPALRAAITLAPLIPTAFYVRAIARWLGRLDELQRRVQYEAWFFATAGTILVVTALNLLAANGIPLGSRLAGGLGWEGTYALALSLWMCGCVISNRRYQ
jgi:hypothetical protein